MCFDMSLFSPLQKIQQFVPVQLSNFIFHPTYHQTAPTFCNWPIVTHQAASYSIELMEWGLVADFMNTPELMRKYRISMANARSEKILDDPRSVWHQIRQQRCLIFCDGFFEHQETGAKKKTPYYIHSKKTTLFAIAGLFHTGPLKDENTGQVKGSFTLITRPANPLMAKIHNGGPNKERMPLILQQEQALEWLEPSLEQSAFRKILEFEYQETNMEAWPVKTIRTQKADTPAIIAPYKPLSLFDEIP